MGPGATFYPEVGVALIETRVKAQLAREGFPAGEVDVAVEERPRGLRLDLVVDEGPPDLLEDVAFIGDLEVLFPDDDDALGGNDRPLRRWARKPD